MVSLQGILNMDMSYAGIKVKFELAIMKEYLSHMEENIDVLCKNYISAEQRKYEGQDYAEYSYIYRVAEEEFPRIIRLPFLVSIYTLFENSITQILKYAQKKEKKELGFNDINARALHSKTNKYLKHILGYDFELGPTDINSISEIIQLRNCIVHANGNLGSLSEEKVKVLQKIKIGRKGLINDHNQIDIPHNYLVKSFDNVESILNALMTYMEKRYDFY